MERYEQMWEAIEQEHGELSRREAFVTLTALEWADKTMIEKACECIIKLHNWPTQYEEYTKLQEEFIKEFRKAMEE